MGTKSSIFGQTLINFASNIIQRYEEFMKKSDGLFKFIWLYQNFKVLV